MIDPRQAYYERKNREEERRAMLRTHICQVCGSALVLCYRPHDAPFTSNEELQLRCGHEKGHLGIVEQKSLRQLWKEKKVPIPLIVAQRFEDQEERRKNDTRDC